MYNRPQWLFPTCDVKVVERVTENTIDMLYSGIDIPVVELDIIRAYMSRPIMVHAIHPIANLNAEGIPKEYTHYCMATDVTSSYSSVPQLYNHLMLQGTGLDNSTKYLLIRSEVLLKHYSVFRDVGDIPERAVMADICYYAEDRHALDVAENEMVLPVYKSSDRYQLNLLDNLDALSKNTASDSIKSSIPPVFDDPKLVSLHELVTYFTITCNLTTIVAKIGDKWFIDVYFKESSDKSVLSKFKQAIRETAAANTIFGDDCMISVCSTSGALSIEVPELECNANYGFLSDLCSYLIEDVSTDTIYPLFNGDGVSANNIMKNFNLIKYDKAKPIWATFRKEWYAREDDLMENECGDDVINFVRAWLDASPTIAADVLINGETYCIRIFLDDSDGAQLAVETFRNDLAYWVSTLGKEYSDSVISYSKDNRSLNINVPMDDYLFTAMQTFVRTCDVVIMNAKHFES